MPRTYAIFGGNLVNWQGGRWFLRLILRSMAMHCRGSADRIALVLPRSSLLGHAAQVAGWGRHAAAEIARLRGPAPLVLEKVPADALDAVAAGIDGPIQTVHCSMLRSSLVAALERVRADVLLPSIRPWPRDFPVAWVGYVPDLQHRCLPEYFTGGEIARRDHEIALLLSGTRSVIVNSAATRNDLQRFFPDAGARLFVLPFAPLLDDEFDNSGAAEVQRAYGIRGPYFLVSNQFWVHKDHRTALRAFKRLIDSSGRADVELVCTGATDDYRARGHFARLLAELDALRLRERVRIPGLVPRADLLALMAGAVALVQPTLFEGGPGGGAVYDAVALGLRALVSDIPVNREIDADGIEFFTAGGAEELAGLMARALADKRTPPGVEELGRRSQWRSALLAERLIEAAEHAIAARR